MNTERLAEICAAAIAAIHELRINNKDITDQGVAEIVLRDLAAGPVPFIEGEPTDDIRTQLVALAAILFRIIGTPFTAEEAAQHVQILEAEMERRAASDEPM
jgi:hypothetical protein